MTHQSDGPEDVDSSLLDAWIAGSTPTPPASSEPALASTMLTGPPMVAPLAPSGWVAPRPPDFPGASSSNVGRPVHKGRRIRWMVGVAVFLGLAGYAAFANRNKVNVTNLKAGQCFNLGVNQSFTDVITIPCSTPHDVEVAARVANVVLVSYPVDSTAGSIPGVTPDSYAGSGSSTSEAKRRCADEIVKYVGGPLDPNLYTPRIITLKSAGYRGDAWCIVRANDFGKLYKSVSGAVH